MLSYSALMLIKEHNRNNDILYVNYNGLDFVFRSISHKEYIDIKKCVNVDKDIEDAICSIAVLYPQDYKFSECPFGGVPERASTAILKMSRIDDPDGVAKIMDVKKDEMESFHNQCINLVKAVFGEYSVEELQDWSWERLIEFAVRAEKILRMKGIDVVLTNHLNSEEEVEVEEVTKEDEEAKTVKLLKEMGVDPMMYYAEQFIDVRNDKPDFPMIGGLHWDREDVLDAIRGQMEKSAKKGN